MLLDINDILIDGYDVSKPVLRDYLEKIQGGRKMLSFFCTGTGDEATELQEAIDACEYGTLGVDIDVSTTVGLTGVDGIILEDCGGSITNTNSSTSTDIDVLTFNGKSKFRVYCNIYGAASLKNLALNTSTTGGWGVVIKNCNDFYVDKGKLSGHMAGSVLITSTGNNDCYDGHIGKILCEDNEDYEIAFTGSINGTTLTVSAISKGNLDGDDVIIITATGVTKGTKILQQLTGTNGSTGTYELSVSHGVLGSRAMTGFNSEYGCGDIVLYSNNGANTGEIRDINIIGSRCLSSNHIGVSLIHAIDSHGSIHDIHGHWIKVRNKSKHGMMAGYASGDEVGTSYNIDFSFNDIEGTDWSGIYYNGVGYGCNFSDNNIGDDCRKVPQPDPNLEWGAIAVVNNGSTAAMAGFTIENNNFHGSNGFSNVSCRYLKNSTIKNNKHFGDGVPLVGQEVDNPGAQAFVALHNCQYVEVDDIIEGTEAEDMPGVLVSVYGSAVNSIGNKIKCTIRGIGNGNNYITVNGGAHNLATEVRGSMLSRITGGIAAPDYGVLVDTGVLGATIEDVDTRYSGVGSLGSPPTYGGHIRDLGTGTHVANNRIGTDPLVGTFTMGANNSTTVLNNNAGYDKGTIEFWPMNAAAATLQSGAKAIYIAAGDMVAGVSFKAKTADGNAAAGTELFGYRIIN